MRTKARKLEYSLAALILVFCFSFTFLAPTAYAGLFDGAKEQACAGVQLSAGAGPNCSDGDATKLSTTIKAAINLISVVVGIIAVIMIIIGGIRFILSDGDSAKVSTARNTIIYALVGLILVAFAQIIVKFVLNRV